MVAVTSWGRLSNFEHEVHALSDRSRVAGQLKADSTGLAYGMGRSYGDVCLNPDGVLWNTTALDKFIRFDTDSGRLCCEAGVLLKDIQQLCLPRGWMLPVVPGTQLVTVGGAIANDVHGKNHHVAGSFGDHVQHIMLARTDGSMHRYAPGDAGFAATVGGLGLTGVITEAEIQLRRVDGPWLNVETLAYRDLQEFFVMADDSEAEWEHTVSWIDCVNTAGRGIFMRAHPLSHAAQAHLSKPSFKKALSVPFVPPVSLINSLSLRAFNALYYASKQANSTSNSQTVQHYEAFLHPLDNLLHWNRIYGPKGFYQYQCVLPRATGELAVQAMLKQIAKAGQGSFLAVLKTFGQRESVGMLSFAQPGVTLALDFPNHDQKTLKLFESLDVILQEAGGRLYAAKDARMPRALFEAGYPRLNEFLPHRDPGISSALSRRLMGS